MKRLALILTLALLGSCEYATAQVLTPTPCDHTSNSKERFDAVRLTPAVKVLDWDGRNLSVRYEDRNQVAFITFTADKDSIMRLAKDYKVGLYWILFCEKDYHVYTAVPLTPEQMGKK